MSYVKFFSIVTFALVGVFFGNVSLHAMSFEEYQKNYPEEYQEENQNEELTTEENEAATPLTPEAKIALLQEKLIAYEEQLKPGNHTIANENSISQGKRIYVKMCRNCHGVGGRGDGPLAKAIKNIGDFTSPDMLSVSDQQIFDQITDGKPPMPSYRKSISEEDRWHLVNYIRTFAPKPNEK